MVSNTLGMELEELLATLERLRTDCAADADYQHLRGDLPEAWPL